MVSESERLETAPGADVPRKGVLRRALDSDLLYSFRRSPLTVAAAVVTVLLITSALACDWIAPHDPFDLASLNIMDSQNPPRGSRAAAGSIRSAPTIRAETSCRRYSTACASRSWWASPRSCWRSRPA